METIQFYYWLKGAFDLSESGILKSDECVIIKEKLKELLEYNEKDVFLGWLNGYFDLVHSEEITSKEIVVIKEKLDKSIKQNHLENIGTLMSRQNRTRIGQHMGNEVRAKC